MVDAPALAPKQDLDPTVSVPGPCLRDLDDPLPQGPGVLAMRTTPMRGPAEANDPAGPPLAHPIDLLEDGHPLPHLGWLQN